MDPNAWVYPVQIPNDVFHFLISLGRCQAILQPHMAAVAKYVGHEYLADWDASMTAIEDVLTALVEKATKA